MENPNSGERKRTATCSLLNGHSKSQNWSTSQLWTRIGQNWSNILFDKFNMQAVPLQEPWIALKMDGSPGGSSSPAKQFLEISRNTRLNRIKGFRS